MGIREAMQRLTHREFLTVRAWLEQQWNRPDRSDYYLMELIATVRRLLAKNPRAIKAEPIKFERRKAAAAIPPDTSLTGRLKAFGGWLGLAGWRPRNTEPEREAGDGN